MSVPVKKRFRFILLIMAGLLVGLFVITKFTLRPDHVGREEIGSLPGAVAYSEGTTRVSELFDEARAFLEKGQVAQAETVYRKIISLEPGNAPGYVGLASCRYYREDIPGAEHEYQEALRRDVRSSQALIGLGSLAQRRGKYEAAVDFYQRALAVDANQTDAYLGLAESYDSLQEAKQAVEHYNVFLKLAS